MLDIKHNLLQIRDEITQVAELSGRRNDDICLVAVSKTKPVGLILEAYAAGQRHFAENYVQEAIQKIQTLKKSHPVEDEKIIWHYIGQIQSNKCDVIAENFAWLHSLSKLKHAKRLNRFREKMQAPLNICLQIQLENNQQRGGIQLADTQAFLDDLIGLHNLKIRGLMCVLPLGWTGNKALDGFEAVKYEFDELKKHLNSLDTLSLGMSGDFKQAIQAGSTLLRLGSAIFGARK